MPYSNVPEKDWPKMESCISDLMEDKEMKDKYKDSKERKSHAIAICHASIVGSKKIEGSEKEMSEDLEKAVWSQAYENTLPDSSFAYVEPGEKDESGKTTPRSKRHLPYKDKDGKIDPAHVRNALARLSQTNISAEAKIKAKNKLIIAAKKVGIQIDSESKKIDSVNDINITKKSTKGGENKIMNDEKNEKVNKVEEKTEEVSTPVVEEKVDVEPETKAEKPAEEKGEKKVEEKIEEEKIAVQKVTEKSETETKADAIIFKVNSVFDAIIKKMDELQKKLQEAPAKGATVMETPVEKAVKPEAVSKPKEEAPKEEAPVLTDKVEKTDASSQGTSEITKILSEIQKRLEKIEASPVPAKVVFHKGIVGTTNKTDELTKIDERLNELLKKRDGIGWSSYEADEAYSLVKDKKTLEQANR